LCNKQLRLQDCLKESSNMSTARSDYFVARIEEVLSSRPSLRFESRIQTCIGDGVDVEVLLAK
jgi:hypothetical protein